MPRCWGRGCLRATLDVLRLAALDPRLLFGGNHPGSYCRLRLIDGAAYEPLSRRRRVGDVEVPQVPVLWFQLISALDALARLGYTLEEPKIAGAVEYLLSRQLPMGPGLWMTAGPAHRSTWVSRARPNKWVTLDALRVVKLLYSQH